MFLLSDPAADNRHDQPDQSIEMHQLESPGEPGAVLQAADNDNLFENNPHHDNNQDRAESPAKDETLEQESDDELFINEGPSLDDDDDDSYQEHTGPFPRDTFDDSSNFVDEEETTYGSPGLREAFNEGYGANNQDRAGSADNGRKNKRKQFKPRNIIYSMNEESEEAGRGRHSHNSERENSPMDLSVGPGPGQPSQESDSDSESSQAAGQEDQTKPKPGGLSVVRPEILFGNNRVAPPPPPSSLSQTSGGSTDVNPLSLLSNLTGIPAGLNPLSSFKSYDEGTSNAMRDAFKEVLKLYGVSSDAAENLMANNDQSRPGKQVSNVALTRGGQQVSSVAAPVWSGGLQWPPSPRYDDHTSHLTQQILT